MLIEDLLHQWNIGEIDMFEPIHEGIGKTWFLKTSQGDFVLKASDLERSEREFKYRRALSQTEIPVALPVMTVDGKWLVENENAQVCFLSPMLPGKIVNEHYMGDAEGRARCFGQAIGLLHACFSRLDDANGSQEMDLIGQLHEWALPTIRKYKKLVSACSIQSIWTEVEANLSALSEQVPLQLIHRDVHPSNMLFDAGRLTGFLDFEMVTRGWRLFDVCYCASSILLGGFEDQEKAQKWPAIFQSLVKGYQQYFPLTPLERKSTYEVLVAIELIFLTYWLEIRNADEAEKVMRLLFWLENQRDAIEI